MSRLIDTVEALCRNKPQILQSVDNKGRLALRELIQDLDIQPSERKMNGVLRFFTDEDDIKTVRIAYHSDKLADLGVAPPNIPDRAKKFLLRFRNAVESQLDHSDGPDAALRDIAVECVRSAAEGVDGAEPFAEDIVEAIDNAIL